MKTQKSILIAFVLNLSFSLFEVIGGLFTGSVAILSDAVHDIGDAASIGISYLLEKRSKKQPDQKYSYGYAGYSVIGALITTLFLISGSLVMIFNAVERLISPAELKGNAMIVISLVGVIVNLFAAYFTHKGDSLNQRAVSLHMLEDVLGWLSVLTGAIIIRLTGFTFIDPIMSVCISVFILVSTLKNMKEITELFLNKVPDGIELSVLKKELVKTEGVFDIHHIHIWKDSQNNYATMHIVTNGEVERIKREIRNKLQNYGIFHVTLETEGQNEHCNETECNTGHIHSLPHYHH